MLRISAAILLALLLPVAAQAHLMVAQRGTLNIVDDGAYLVLSLPVSAFRGVDDDGDGQLSGAEMAAHAGAIEAQVLRGVRLLDAGKPLPLEGLLLNGLPPDNAPLGPASQIVVLGRFALGRQQQSLALNVGLYGGQATEQALDVTVTRKPQSQLIRFAPGNERHAIMPPASVVFADFLRLGAEHILTGPDHLLFLLVVVAAARGVRQMALTLTCFTAGHALTLGACVLGGWSLPAVIVEPAIGATIVGLAVFDWWSRHHVPVSPQALRLALVFGCALIHGLGFSNGLLALGVDSQHVLWSLAGFNLGIELAQLGVALPAVALLWLVRQRSMRNSVSPIPGTNTAITGQ